jgi:hypothetical protein
MIAMPTPNSPIPCCFRIRIKTGTTDSQFPTPLRLLATLLQDTAGPPLKMLLSYPIEF